MSTRLGRNQENCRLRSRERRDLALTVVDCGRMASVGAGRRSSAGPRAQSGFVDADLDGPLKAHDIQESSSPA
jgi:hypothetical protein